MRQRLSISVQIYIASQYDSGIMYNDSDLNIDWKLKEYGQYEKYEELMGKVFHGTEGVET